MYELARLNFTSLEPKSIQIFQQFIEPKFHACLMGQDPYGVSNTKIVAVGAFCHGVPVGIAIASLKNYLHFVDIYCLFVDPHHRRQKMGTRLFGQLQDELRKEKASTLALSYPLGDDTTLAFEKILLTNGWVNTRPFMVKCIFTRDKFPRQWVKHPLTFPAGFEEFSWRELTQKERGQLHSMEAQKIFPPSVSPFIDEENIEYTNSLGLRFHGEVVGWIITHRLNFETIKYSSFFIKKEFRNLGSAIKLLIDAIELHWQSPILQGSLEISLILVDNSWIQFVNRRLIPNATTVTYFNQAWKKLSSK